MNTKLLSFAKRHKLALSYVTLICAFVSLTSNSYKSSVTYPSDPQCQEETIMAVDSIVTKGRADYGLAVTCIEVTIEDEGHNGVSSSIDLPTGFDAVSKRIRKEIVERLFDEDAQKRIAAATEKDLVKVFKQELEARMSGYGFVDLDEDGKPDSYLAHSEQVELLKPLSDRIIQIDFYVSDEEEGYPRMGYTFVCTYRRSDGEPFDNWFENTDAGGPLSMLYTKEVCKRYNEAEGWGLPYVDEQFEEPVAPFKIPFCYLTDKGFCFEFPNPSVRMGATCELDVLIPIKKAKPFLTKEAKDLLF